MRDNPAENNKNYEHAKTYQANKKKQGDREVFLKGPV